MLWEWRLLPHCPVTQTGELKILSINVIKLRSGASKKFGEGGHDLLKVLRWRMAWIWKEARTSKLTTALVVRNNLKHKTDHCAQTPLALILEPAPLQHGRRLTTNSLLWATRHKAETSWRVPRAAPRLLPQGKKFNLFCCCRYETGLKGFTAVGLTALKHWLADIELRMHYPVHVPSDGLSEKSTPPPGVGDVCYYVGVTQRFEN